MTMGTRGISLLMVCAVAGAPALAETCNTHKAEVLEAGARMNAAAETLRTIHNDFLLEQSYLVWAENEGMAFGYDEELDEMIATTRDNIAALDVRWQDGQRELQSSDRRLAGAIALHETACGPRKQTDTWLAELGLNKNP